MRGGQHKRALEVHPEEEATMVVSKRINLGHNSRVELIEASTVRGGRHKKRALELHLHEEDSDEYQEKEPTFVAGADGAYTNLEMPKRINLGYNVGESSARMRALDAEDERDAALILRLSSAIRDMYTKAKAKEAAADQRT